MLKVIAKVILKSEDSVDFVKQEMLKLGVETRQETGCEEYLLHQDRDDSRVFFFYETWNSESELTAHLKTDHVAAYVEATKGMIESFAMNKLDIVE